MDNEDGLDNATNGDVQIEQIDDEPKAVERDEIVVVVSNEKKLPLNNENDNRENLTSGESLCPSIFSEWIENAPTNFYSSAMYRGAPKLAHQSLPLIDYLCLSYGECSVKDLQVVNKPTFF